ncbi:MAG: pentapeptide repeat-containing protein, partial [Pseudomonadota bacterium]
MSEHHWLAVIFIAIPIGVGLAVVTFPTNNRVTRDWCDKRITEIADALKPLNIPGWMKVFGVITWALLFLSFVLGSFFVIFYGIAQLPQVTGLTTALTGTDPDGIEAGDYRWYLLTLTALTAGLGAAVALPFTIRRSIQNERQTKTQEESHVTEQINEAVANLAAQKEVNRLGRTLTYIEDGETKSVFEWQDSPFELPKDAKEDTDKSTPWIHVTVTEPNIEVRIGAILSLERLARQRAEASQVTTKRTEDSILDHDGARDHVRIMQILCAYVRENAKAENAQTFAPQSFDEFIAGLTKEQRAEIDEDPLQSKDRAYRTHLDALIGELETPRTDLQIALRVLGRRTEVQRACEGVETEQKGTVNGTEITRHDWAGYRLDLRDSNLRHVDLGHGSADPMDLRHTRLEGAQFQGANLRDAQLQGADFGRAQLQGAILKDAQLQGANLGGAQLQGANLERAQLQGTYLRDAQLQGANLWEAQLQGADLARAQLQGAILWGAQLQGANLGSAQLQGANLGSAQLQGADLGRAK